ncbi:hypothetical protein N9A49_04125 [Salibacteraceae bacterium]|jgi:ABC-type glycerol-3-phosphate transport system substrate-binding protein|nr:hypothetical protein [Salibacteraceae bacterium]MDB9708465.1 hypothetical protein [Salibacteraceae bacterium]HAQ69716.1 hypothetical protein [Flavobacteriales bacterium]
MKKPLFIAAMLLGLTSISFAQSSSQHEEKNIKIIIEEDVNGKTTTTVLEGEEAEEYLEKMDKELEEEISIHLEHSLNDLEKNIEISLEVLEKELDAIDWDEYSEKIEIKIEKITDEIHTKILESQPH